MDQSPYSTPKQQLTVVDGKQCQHRAGPKDIAMQ